MRFFAANGTFCAVCGIFCGRLPAVVHPGPHPQSIALHPAGCCCGYGIGAAHGKPAGAHPGAICRPSADADRRGGKHGGFLRSRYRGCGFACRESERQRGILPGGVQCFAGVQSRGKGAGKIYTVGPGIRKPGQPVCGRHRSAGGNGRGWAGAYSSGRKRQLPRPHPPPAAKAQCVAAPPYGRQDRRCAGCHDYRRPELSVFGHAQRLPGRGSCPCAGGKRNACVHFVR